MFVGCLCIVCMKTVGVKSPGDAYVSNKPYVHVGYDSYCYDSKLVSEGGVNVFRRQ